MSKSDVNTKRSIAFFHCRKIKENQTYCAIFFAIPNRISRYENYEICLL